jgi:16S rRNA (guanine966-N2)-methyltransferase
MSGVGLRVTGGRLGGRRLRAPRRGVRPSADRVRESLFGWLGDLEGAAVLDLFAGSGALGIEALSRGAASLISVERSRAALSVLRANLAALELESASRVMAGDAVAVIARLGRAGERFDLVLLDPPYASDLAHAALAALVAANLLAPGATVVLERSRSHSVDAVPGLAPLEERRYGDTVITRFAVSAPDSERPGAGGDGGRST